MNKTAQTIFIATAISATLQLIGIFIFAELISAIITFFVRVPDTRLAVGLSEAVIILQLHVFRFKEMKPEVRTVFSSRFVRMCIFLPLMGAISLLGFDINGYIFGSLLLVSLFSFRYQLLVHKQRGIFGSQS